MGEHRVGGVQGKSRTAAGAARPALRKSPLGMAMHRVLRRGSTRQRGGLDLDLGGGGVSVKQVGVVLLVVFAVALAVVVGKEMSAEAMAVVIGVVCGVAAGIPTSVLLLVVLTRRERQREEVARRESRPGAYPPVVVIQGGAPQVLPPGMLPGGSLQGAGSGYWAGPMPGPPVQRDFHVVGGEDLLIDDGQYR